MKQRYFFPSYPRQQQGFGLLEFLIASVLGIGVLLAASAVYLNAQRIHTASKTHINQQNLIRLASEQFRQDARIAGSFACFQVNGANAIQHGVSPLPSFTADGIMHIPASDNRLNLPNFVPSAPLLLLSYGSQPIAVNKLFKHENTANIHKVELAQNPPFNQHTPLLFSSCRIIDAAHTMNVQQQTISQLALHPEHIVEELHLMRYVAVVYGLGKTPQNPEQAWYRFELRADGTWDGPQQLISPVQSLDTYFVYAEHCPQDKENGEEQFFITQTLNPPAQQRLPLAIHINLRSPHQGKMQQYQIDANIRGGNVCNNRVR